MWRSLFLLAFPLTLWAQAPSEPAAETKPGFETILLQPDLWGRTPEQLAEPLKAWRFQWTSTVRDTARTDAPGLSLSRHPLTEALFRFQNGQLTAANLLYYSRGTAESLSEKNFDALLVGLREDLTTLTGAQPQPRPANLASAVRMEGLLWETPASQFLLEWSVTRESRTKGIPFRAEFIRLTVSPKSTQTLAIGQVAPTNMAKAALAKFNGRDHIEKRPTGDVLLKDLPMVDQGQKGYCVVATVERVMRYYGVPVDQDELAQIANSDAAGGTSVNAMIASLNKLTARLRVKVKTLFTMDIREFLDVMTDYNRAAKKEKVEQVNLGGQIIDADECFRTVKPELYREVRLKKATDRGKFQREIQRSIDEGLPLLWSVRLGLVQEKELLPQVFGGHMRLITGYNTKTNEIIYSDSWGLGHEEKRMPLDDAWTITMGLNSLSPVGT